MWKNIKNYRQYNLSVTEYGEVRNNETGHLYREYYGSDGNYIKLHNNGIATKLYIDKLVIEAFLGPAPNDEDYKIEHIDGCLNNNHIDNLRWKRRTFEVYDRNPYRGRRILVNETGEVFEDIYACGRALNISTKSIKACLRSSYVKNCGGYTFRFID